MQRQAVYELSCCKPHEPAGKPMPAREWDLYNAGYQMALVKALQVMDFAAERYRTYLRTRRLETRRRRQAREQP